MSESFRRSLQQVRSLVWKNFLLRRQNVRTSLTTLLEVLLPVLVVYILTRIHTLTPDVTTPQSFHPNSAITTNPSATAALLANYPQLNASTPNLQKICFLSSDSSNESTVALSRLASAFTSAYPILGPSVLLSLPASQSVDDYVTSNDYGQDPLHPYIVAAVLVEQFGSPSNAYQWRYNPSTQPERQHRQHRPARHHPSVEGRPVQVLGQTHHQPTPHFPPLPPFLP